MKEVIITPNQIKKAIQDLVNENEMLQDKVYKLESIIKEAREYIEKNAITNISYLGTKATIKELFKDNASLYELLEILNKVGNE